VILDALPLTPNGKVDRRGLPKPDQTRLDVEANYVAPHTQVERTIAAVWQEVLHLENIGIHDNFFEIGGHSLIATQIISRLRQVFQMDLSVRTLFEAPTIASFAECCEILKGTVQKLQDSFDIYDGEYEEIEI
jgi:acyl carrier protein